MSPSFKAYSADSKPKSLFWPVFVSVLGHLLLVAVVLISPDWLRDDDSYLLPGAITVEMVGGLPTAGPPDRQPGPPGEAALQPKAPPKPLPKAEPKEQSEPVVAKVEAKAAPEPLVAPKLDAKAEISLAPSPPKPKTALKYKTAKSKEEIQSALKQLEQKVEQKTEQVAQEANARQLQDTLKKLKEQVSRQERTSSGSSGGGGGSGLPEAGSGSAGGIGGPGQGGGFGQGGQQEPELVDIYRLEVAFHIQKNWAYAGGAENLVAMVVFKVMPDGTIPEKDIFFTDRSGNASLDDSAYRAIVKSSPTRPHPPGIRKPFVEIGLRFTPKGVQ